MNYAHLHLLINHLPIAGLVFGLLILAWSTKDKNINTQRVGLAVLVLSGVLAAIAFLTGDPAEDVIKNLPNFSKKIVHDHEEAAELAIWFIGSTGAAALLSLWWSLRKHAVPRFLFSLVVVLTVVSLVLIGRTNNLGGQISHPEIRPSVTLGVPGGAGK